MASDSRFGQMLGNLGDKLNEQEWFQELKGKWEELDPQSKTYLRAAVSIGGALLVVIIVLTSIFRVHSLKREYSDKVELLTLIQNANEELRRLKDQSTAPPAAAGGNVTWPAFTDQIAATAGVDKTSVSVTGEKSGAAGELSKETLFDVSLKHVSVKQVIRMAYYLENGGRPVKLRNLSIDTKADPSGYMDATLSVSGFTMLAAAAGK